MESLIPGEETEIRSAKRPQGGGGGVLLNKTDGGPGILIGGLRLRMNQDI